MRWSDPTSLASLAAREEGEAAAHPKAIREGVMTALGREGERALECIDPSFQRTAAAKCSSAPPPQAMNCLTTVPTTLAMGWPTAACSATGGAGDTNYRLHAADALHALPRRG